jgi:hypothetical protein
MAKQSVAEMPYPQTRSPERKSPKRAMESDHGEPRVRKTPGLSVCRRSQDLITDEAGQRMWVALFARLFPQAYQRLPSLQVPK